MPRPYLWSHAFLFLQQFWLASKELIGVIGSRFSPTVFQREGQFCEGVYSVSRPDRILITILYMIRPLQCLYAFDGGNKLNRRKKEKEFETQMDKNLVSRYRWNTNVQ